MRGLGLGCVNIPSMTSAYSSVKPADLPSATTAINLAQRLGGPLGTTGLALLLTHVAFAPSFVLLCAFSAACVVAACGLPARLADVSPS